MKLDGKTVVVTGGAGRVLVAALLAKGCRVAAVDINEAALGQLKKEATAGERLSVHVADITDFSAVQALAEDVIAAHGAVDCVINNAGVIQPFVTIDELGLDVAERMMKINYYGALYMIKAFLPYLKKRPLAYIANVSSMGGFLPVPGQVAYGASKSAMRLLSEGLYIELKGTSVGVSLMMPGGMSTDIAKNSGTKLNAKMESSSMSKIMLSPQKAARLILRAIEKEKFRVFLGFDSKILNVVYKFAPRAAMNLIARALK